jgi:hypothetical protein
MRKFRAVAWVLIAISAVAVAFFLGFRAGDANALHRLVGQTDGAKRVPLLVRHTLGLEIPHGLYGQDLWLLHDLYAGVENGYFVDLGSADGLADSNSKLLEEHGWKGICIDPFPSNMQSRTCTMFKEVVDSEAGRTVRFQNPGSFSGGIVSYAGHWVSDKDKQNVVDLTTTTLADILGRAEAPPFIHYMNVDIEGAEYDALKAFPFDRYTVGAFTIEHNNIEERRQKIRSLLEAHGYRLEWSIRDQDWYVPAAT